MNAQDNDSHDPMHHVKKISGMLDAVAQHCREDISKITEPKAQVLFETTAEVILGLRTAYDHYATGQEEAMRH